VTTNGDNAQQIYWKANWEPELNK